MLHVCALPTYEIYQLLLLCPEPALSQRKRSGDYEKGLVTMELFLGCAKSAIFVLNNTGPISVVYVRARLDGVALFDWLVQIKTVDSEQPRNCSIITRPFSS